MKESVRFYRNALSMPARPGEDYPWVAECFLQVKFASSEGDSVILTGPLLRWAKPSAADAANAFTFLWMATVPLDCPITADLFRVFGHEAEFAPVAWRLPRYQGWPGADDTWSPFPDHVPWKAHQQTRDMQELEAMSAFTVASNLPGRTYAHQLPLPKCVEIIFSVFLEGSPLCLSQSPCLLIFFCCCC